LLIALCILKKPSGYPHETLRKEIKGMKQKRLSLLMALMLILAQLPMAFAEERKSLKELLFEKGILTKDEAANVQETKFSKWIDRITLSGDFRLRHESFMKDPAKDRHRQRFRLRIGPEIKINDFTLGIRLASGTGEQVSTNQSFDNFFNQKPIFIDRAYLQWKGMGWLILTGGCMPNPFFTIYTTDVVWDDDLNPEGFAENFMFKVSDSLNLFANLGQFILDEDSGFNRDQWLFGEQVGAHVTFTKETKASLAVAYYDYTNATINSFGQTAVQAGNTRVSATDPTLVNPFRVLDLTGELSTTVGSLPISLQADFVKNTANTTTGEDKGYQIGLKLGKASDPHTWELAYFYKLLETDATVADHADSDFGDGGTNRKGHILWGAYNLTKGLQFKTKFFRTKVENASLPPGTDDIDRLQVDLSMKF
jgi:hypothetical protein